MAGKPNVNLIGPRFKNRSFYSQSVYDARYRDTHGPRILTEEQKERQREYNRNWHAIARKAKPDYLVKRRDAKLRRKYNITFERQQEMRAEQNNACAICGTPFNETRAGSPRVDHSHEHGRVRQLLCDSCNVGLGRFEDNADWLRKAAEYVERNDQKFAEGTNENSTTLTND